MTHNVKNKNIHCNTPTVRQWPIHFSVPIDVLRAANLLLKLFLPLLAELCNAGLQFRPPQVKRKVYLINISNITINKYLQFCDFWKQNGSNYDSAPSLNSSSVYTSAPRANVRPSHKDTNYTNSAQGSCVMLSLFRFGEQPCMRQSNTSIFFWTALAYPRFMLKLLYLQVRQTYYKLSKLSYTIMTLWKVRTC